MFKPFQPPSLKKPKPQSDASNNSQPAKRRRISSDDDDTKTKEGSHSFAAAIETHRLSKPHPGHRKPLLPVRNSTNSEPSQNEEDDGKGVEGFYNVLWYATPFSGFECVSILIAINEKSGIN